MEEIWIKEEYDIIDETDNIDDESVKKIDINLSESDNKLLNELMKNKTLDSLLPKKTKVNYLKTYVNFVSWKNKNNIQDSEEQNVYDFFVHLQETFSPNTLWSIYSMLKKVIGILEKKYLDRYHSINSLLKQANKNYQPKTSQILTEEEMAKFFKEADDKNYLLHKVVMIFGIEGCLRKSELYNIKMKHLSDKGDLLVVSIPTSKNSKPKTFVISDLFYDYYKKYLALRPKITKTNKFFICLRNGKCINSPVGINKIASVPKEIATFLKLKDPESYTGHALRRFDNISDSNNLNTKKSVKFVKENTIVEKKRDIS